MVQVAHLWKLDDRSLLRGQHRPRNRAVLCQRPMRTRVVIVLEEILEDFLEMSFADDDNMIQVPSPLFYEGRVYLVCNGGQMSSFDAKTGNPIYAQERLGAIGNYYASPVAADGRIYVASLLGKITVVKAGGEKPEILHRADFGERFLATPVLVGDKFYVRTATHLWAFGS